MQDRTHLDVLEVERELLATVGRAVGVAFLQVVDGHGPDADGELVVGLVGRVVESPAGFDADGRPVAAGAGIDELHRGGEVLDVQAHPQRLGQLGPGEIEDDLAFALLDVRGDGRIRQVDHHVAFALGPALEVHPTDRLAHRRTGPRRRSAGNRRARGLGGGVLRGSALRGGALANHHEQVVTFDPGVIRRQLGKADDQPSTIPSLDHSGAACIAPAQVAALAGKLIGHARQVQRNPRRLFGGVAPG